MADGPPLARIAWRNLWRNRRRTILTLVSIAFGMSLCVLMTAMQDRSFADMIDRAARMGSGHVTLQHEEYLDTPTLTRTVKGAEALRAAVEAEPGVARAVTRISGPLMLNTAGQSAGAFVIAYDPAQEDTGTLDMLDSISSGNAPQNADGQEIVLGKRLADNLDVELGNKVVYTMMDREGEIVSGLARVSGIITSGSDGIDAGMALLPIDRLRTVLSYEPDEATVVAVFAEDSRRSPSLASRIRGTLTGTTTALPWDEIRPELSGFIAMKVGGSVFMELVLLLMVAAGIFNTMFVSVMERSREFGVLLAIGWSQSQVIRLILWESAWMALVGVTASCALLAWPYSYLAEHGIDLTAQLGGEGVQVAGVPMEMVLPVGIFPENFVLIVLAVVAATMLAGLLPALRAGRLNPVDAIKLV